MKPRIAFYTFGCRLNQAETAIIHQSFAEKDYQAVDYRDDPDVVVVNTCTVTENGDADTRRFINKINRLSPKAKIALIGCQAQVQRGRLLDLPGVNWVVGNAEKMNLVNIFENSGVDTPQLITPAIGKKSFTIPVPGIDKNHIRANLKIQDGCDFFCSFCEIPYARGRARSREFNDIKKEAVQLVKAGHKELVITGINVGTYQFSGKSFMNVITSLEEIEKLKRIRISSIEPTTIPVSLLDKMTAQSKVCQYLHIPIQSGSDEILSAMKRKYTVTEFMEFLLLAERNVPEACLGTDVIVGFPGETNGHFDETVNLLEKLPLAYFHVFSYSDRDHAKSSRYQNKVSLEDIRLRSRILRQLSINKRNQFLEKFIGKKLEVLFEQKKNGFWTGLTDNYIRAKVESDLDLKNQLIPVKLQSIEKQVMVGTIE
jgi:threonylcarbamoyladenosine tRNA methylthiotransferase MtaB